MYPEKTTDLPSVTLSHNVVSITPPLSGIRTHNVSGALGTDGRGSYKSNYHTITTRRPL